MKIKRRKIRHDKNSSSLLSTIGYIFVSTIAYFLLAAALSILLAWGYQSVVTLSPFIKLNILISMIFGGILGGMSYLAIRKGHSRNLLLTVIFTTALVLIFVGTSHYWGYRVFSNKVSFSEYLALKRAIGWTISHHESSNDPPLRGNVIWVVWLGEGIIVGIFAIRVIWKAAKDPYCDACEKWCTKQKYVYLPGVAGITVKPLIEEGNLSAILDLPTSGNSPTEKIILCCNYCPTCDATAFLSVKLGVTTISKKKTPTKETELLSNAILTSAQRAKLLAVRNPHILYIPK